MEIPRGLSPDERDTIEHEAEIERLMFILMPFVPVARAILSEAPPDAGYFSIFKSCDGQSFRITMDELRAVDQAFADKNG